MMTMTVTFDLTLIYFVAINISAILAYVLFVKHRARTEKRDGARLAAAIHEFFELSGSKVGVSCVRPPMRNSFSAFIEAEPLKQFRLSHLIEIALRKHLQEVRGLRVGKVFWRFPISGASEDVLRTSNKELANADQYMDAGLERVQQQYANSRLL
jgi:hypothetical protein